MKEYLEKLKADSLTPLPEKNFDNYYHDYWLYVNLYYPDTQEIVHTWTRPDFNQSVTTFAFVSLSSLENPTEYCLINRDFWYIANKREINNSSGLLWTKYWNKLTKKEKAAHKTDFASGRLTCKFEVLCFYSSWLTVMRSETRQTQSQKTLGKML
jgi:hypothetical protein